MRRILGCNVRYGLQAVLELELPVTAILTDGIIVYCSEQAYENWSARYEELHTGRSRKWNKEQWQELGYELKYRPHGPFGSWYPVKKDKEKERERSN